MNRPSVSTVRTATTVLLTFNLGLAIGMHADRKPDPVHVDVEITCVSVLPAKVECTSGSRAL